MGCVKDLRSSWAWLRIKPGDLLKTPVRERGMRLLTVVPCKLCTSELMDAKGEENIL